MKATNGAVNNICSEYGCSDTVVLKITQLEVVSETKCTGCLTDGSGEKMNGILSKQVSDQVRSKEIQDGALLEVLNYQCNRINDVPHLVLLQAEAIAEDEDDVMNEAAVVKSEPQTSMAGADEGMAAGGGIVRKEGDSSTKKENRPPTTAAGGESTGNGVEKTEGNGIIKKETATAATTAAAGKTVATGAATAVPAAETVAPSSTPAFKKSTIVTTPGSSRGGAGRRQSLTPITPTSARKPVPIAALNPYNMVWTIRARVSNKAPLRSFVRDGASKSVFTMELIDDTGAVIEGTLWAEFADDHYDMLHEGKVYLFSNGKVKPANRRYSGLRSDYCINFDTGSRIEECEDQDVSKMEVKADYVTIDHLPAYVGKKTLVDVVGIVKEVTPLGSVKRKSDNTELNRRDLTLVDSSSKTVRLTVWGQLAEDLARLETMTAPVISVTSCRVSDFDGVSLSSLQRSVVAIGDDVFAPEAAKLRSWYDSGGANAAAVPVGEGLSNASGQTGGAAYTTMAALQTPPEGPPPPEAKPVSHICNGTVVLVNREQTFYYTATPENSYRKVTPVAGGWHCEGDGRTYTKMVRRYVLLIKVADSSGEAFLNLFNDEAEKLLGMTADELHELREGNPGGGLPALEASLWSDWTFRVQTRSKEFNGQVKQRVNVTSMHRTDYAAESARMLAELSKMT